MIKIYNPEIEGIKIIMKVNGKELPQTMTINPKFLDQSLLNKNIINRDEVYLNMSKRFMEVLINNYKIIKGE